MKWKNHVEIAKAIAHALDLAPELASILVEGSIQPDKEADKVIRIGRRKTLYRARMAHHHADRRFVMKLIWKARKAWLEGRDGDAAWCLGRAIHYIEDLSVATGPFSMFHNSRENEMARYEVSESSISVGLRGSINSPHFVWGCIRSLSAYPDSSEALFHASMYAAAISSSVMGDVHPPSQLVRELNRARRRHYFVLLPLAIAVALALGALALFLEPAIVVVAPALFALILLADRDHAYLRVEGRWFGIGA